MKEQEIYEFGAYRLLPGEQLLLRDGKSVPLPPKVFDILTILVRNQGSMMEKDELLKRVWGETFVEEGSLTRAISTLRKMLEEDRSNGCRYIETVPKRGYRFVAQVSALHAADHAFSSAVTSVDNRSLSPQPAADSAVLSPSSAPSVPVKSKIKTVPLRTAVFSIVVVLALSLVIVAVYQLRSRAVEHDFATFTMTKLSDSGKVHEVAISPDGKYLAYSLKKSNSPLLSLWVRRLATNSDVSLEPPSMILYQGFVFSPDGDFLYYVAENVPEHGALYQIPSLGGIPKKLINDVAGPVALSPDGSHVVFVRSNAARQQSELTIANSDGTGEKILATSKTAETLRLPAWSPDGRMIACVAGSLNGSVPNSRIAGFRTKDGARISVGNDAWVQITGLAWMRDESGLVMTAIPKSSTIPQVWVISYPNGEVRKITNDPNNYRGVSFAASSSTMVTVQTSTVSGIWVGQSGVKFEQITSGTGEGMHGLSWTPEGKLLYTLGVSGTLGAHDIWMMDADGSHRQQLTSNQGSNYSVSACGNGRYIVFVSTRTSKEHIWRINVDGSNAVQLTDGGGEGSPRCSSDGRWVAYVANGGAKWTLWKIPIDGGRSTQLTTISSGTPAISPDGKLIAFGFHDEAKNAAGVTVIPFGGGQPSRVFKIQTPPLRWSPDGKSLIYKVGSNVWSQPLDGKPARQLTSFDDSWIFNFDLSADGRRLACVRGFVIENAVQLTDTQRSR